MDEHQPPTTTAKNRQNYGHSSSNIGRMDFAQEDAELRRRRNNKKRTKRRDYDDDEDDYDEDDNHTSNEEV